MNQILLVEDNPTDVLLTRRALRDADLNAELKVARDGVEAFDMLTQELIEGEVSHPELILMDINMPRKNGQDLLREIKADARLKHIPVVMLTTSESHTDIRRAYDNHASGYIVKPNTTSAFRDAILALKSFWFRTVVLPQN